MNADCVVLAAGRGTRLRGVVPEFYKPLMTVDGQALIVHVIGRARECADVGNIILVVAPDNAAPITSLLRDAGLLDHRLSIVVQHTPDGPGGAFLVAQPLVMTDDVLLLMSDNIFGEKDIPRVMSGEGKVVVGGRTESSPDVAQKFTRISSEGRAFEGSFGGIQNEMYETGYFIWLGPLRVNVSGFMMQLALHRGIDDRELKIGPSLNFTDDITIVMCETHDVGTIQGINGGS